MGKRSVKAVGVATKNGNLVALVRTRLQGWIDVMRDEYTDHMSFILQQYELRCSI